MTSDTPYAGLGPDQVLAAVERLGLPCDGRLLALNSYENRVYRIGLEDGRFIVAKFYRPERWSDQAIDEEHAFTLELAEAELAVSTPLVIDGRSLHHHDGLRYALFAAVGGRAPETDDRDSLRQLGRMLGRLHAVGARHRFAHRPVLDVARFGREPVTWLLANDWLPPHLVDPFQRLADELLAAVDTAWQRAGDVRSLRLHGDVHPGNILVRDGEPLLVDFDDCLTGPAIQDLWMLLSGDGDDLRRSFGWLLEGYQMFADLDPREWHLVEALRTLRLLHYHGWIARRWHDPAFPAAFPWFIDNRHWENLIGQMHEQLAALQEPPLL